MSRVAAAGGRRKAGFAVALAAVALVAACGGGGDCDKPPPPDLAKAPANVRWLPYQGVALPHTDDGPARDEATTSTGFKRSPQGAAVAAVVHNVHVSMAPDETWAKVLAVEVAPGPGRDEWSVKRTLVSFKGTEQKFAPRVLGYKFNSYDENKAEATVLIELSDKSRAAVRVTVTWLDNDWRLVLPDKTTTQRPVEAISELPRDMVRLEAPVR